MDKESKTSITFKLEDSQLEDLRQSITEEVLKKIEINPELYNVKVKTPLVLHTVEEVAKILDLSASTVRNYIEENKIGCYRPGRNYKISREQIDAYLQSIKSI